MRGDTKIVFRHIGFTNKTLFRIMFNTAFIQNGNYIHAGKMELSPEDIRKDKGKVIPNDFVLYLQFEDFCQVCDPHKTEIDELCDSCVTELGSENINAWQCVKKITDSHSYPTLEQGKQYLPGVDLQRYDELLKTELKFNTDYYRIVDLTKLNQEEKEETKT